MTATIRRTTVARVLTDEQVAEAASALYQAEVDSKPITGDLGDVSGR